MRFFQTLISVALAALAALAVAQTVQPNYINVPTTGFNAVAGQPLTITWQNPSSTTVTIRLVQGGNTTPGSGILLASGIKASLETATFTIPTNVNQAQYNFEIIDDSNQDQPNYSSGFTIAGGSVSASASTSGTATSTGTSSMSSMSSMSSSVSSSASRSSSSASSSASSPSSSSSSSSASSSASSASSSASASASSAQSSASASATSAPHSNGVGVLRAGGLMAVVAGAIAVF